MQANWSVYSFVYYLHTRSFIPWMLKNTSAVEKLEHTKMKRRLCQPLRNSRLFLCFLRLVHPPVPPPSHPSSQSSFHLYRMSMGISLALPPLYYSPVIYYGSCMGSHFLCFQVARPSSVQYVRADVESCPFMGFSSPMHVSCLFYRVSITC